MFNKPKNPFSQSFLPSKDKNGKVVAKDINPDPHDDKNSKKQKNAMLSEGGKA